MNWTQVQDDLGYKISTIFTPAPELAYQASASNQPMVIQQPGSITAQQFDKLAALITQKSNQA
jgi:MinD-like ATPase involved in chromosome partitioning or flagellar assembly